MEPWTNSVKSPGPSPNPPRALTDPWAAACSPSSSVNAPQALEDMKGDVIIAVEKSLESEAWAQLWTLRITVSVRTRASGQKQGETQVLPTSPLQFPSVSSEGPGRSLEVPWETKVPEVTERPQVGSRGGGRKRGQQSLVHNVGPLWMNSHRGGGNCWGIGPFLEFLALPLLLPAPMERVGAPPSGKHKHITWAPRVFSRKVLGIRCLDLPWTQWWVRDKGEEAAAVGCAQRGRGPASSGTLVPGFTG